jgi:hypothetical protein
MNIPCRFVCDLMIGYHRPMKYTVAGNTGLRQSRHRLRRASRLWTGIRFRPRAWMALFRVRFMVRIFAVAGVFAVSGLAGYSGVAMAQSGPQADTLLNSERIEQRFGSYGIEVLEAEGAVRVSNLFSEHDRQRITRTFAVVTFAEEIPVAAADAHAQIMAGGSIGAVFASHGWTVSRRHLWFGEVPASDRVLAMMQAAAPAALATHIFELIVSRPDEPPFSYATIAEVHHPAYLSLAELGDIFSIPSDAITQEHEAAIAAMLARVHDAMQ